MNTPNSINYFAARERRELELAEAATHPAVVSAHLEMAERYAQLVLSGPGHAKNM